MHTDMHVVNTLKEGGFPGLHLQTGIMGGKLNQASRNVHDYCRCDMRVHNIIVLLHFYDGFPPCIFASQGYYVHFVPARNEVDIVPLACKNALLFS